MTQPVRRPSARVVIINWRQAEPTIRTARSIREQLGGEDVLVIVDNVSGDGSAERLRRERLTVVESSENRGFGAGVNFGARDMVEEVLILFNNDTVAEPGFLEALLALPGDPPPATAPVATTARILLAGRWKLVAPGQQDALVSPRIGRRTYLDEGVAARDEGEVLVNSTGNLVDAFGNGYDRDWLAPAGQRHSPGEVFSLCGGACAIRHEARQALRGFRRDLFMYCEDTDLSWRLRGRGWRVLYVCEAVAHHDHVSSSGTDSPMFIQVNVRNRILTAAAHSPVPVAMQILARTPVRTLRGPQRDPVLKGLTQALTGLSRELHRRARNRVRGSVRSC